MHRQLTMERTVAKKAPTPASEERDRFDLRLDPEFRERIKRQADRMQLNMSAYIRRALALQVEQDESTEPK